MVLVRTQHLLICKFVNSHNRETSILDYKIKQTVVPQSPKMVLPFSPCNDLLSSKQNLPGILKVERDKESLAVILTQFLLSWTRSQEKACLKEDVLEIHHECES